jgi:hypothetical protein
MRWTGSLKQKYEAYVEFMQSMGAEDIMTFDEWLRG